MSFYNDNVKFTSIDLNFYSNANAFEMAYLNSDIHYMQDSSGHKYDYNYYVSFYINMGKVTVDSLDENGGNLDRVLAHEFTHVL